MQTYPTNAEADFDLIIEPSRGWVSLQLRHIWEFRELLCFLVWRNIKVRYKQTVLGAAWAILQGLAAEELQKNELLHYDPQYEVLITLRAEKPLP